MKKRNVEDEEQESPQQQQDVQPPKRKINKKVLGKIRKYYYVKTVKSMEELEKFRFKKCCVHNSDYKRPWKTLKMPCNRKMRGKGCDFDLMALRSADSENGVIHVYEHSQHTHPILPEEKRALIRRETELMPADNPPAIFRTPDNKEWTLLRTFPNYDQLQQFRRENECQSASGRVTSWRLRFLCNRQRSTTNICKYTLLALKTTTQGYHVYKNGEHNNHPARRNRKVRQNEEEAEDSEEEDKESNADEDEVQEREKDDDEDEDDKDDDDDDEDDNDDEEEEKEEGEQPPQHQEGQPFAASKISKKVNGQIRKYNFLTTVKSMEELDNIRLKNYCDFVNGKPLQILRSYIMPCLKKKRAKKCNFELLALSSTDSDSAHIHVYSFSQHSNHPFTPVRRRICTKAKDVMMMPMPADEKPQKIFHTEDNSEWTFVQTFPDYDQMQKFRRKNQCRTRWDKNAWRISCPCNRKYTHNCKFILLALKTTNNGYHVYKQGKHKHNNSNRPIKRRKRSVRNQQQKSKQMENDGEEVEGEAEEEEAVPMEEDDGTEMDQEESDEENEENMQIVEDEQEEKKDEKIKIEIIENPFKNTGAEKMEEKLEKANRKVYKWMAGIEPNEIGRTIGEWDKSSLLKMVEMADQEIREHPEKLNLWLPWLKCAIPKCLSQIEGFYARFKDLIKLTFE